MCTYLSIQSPQVELLQKICETDVQEWSRVSEIEASVGNAYVYQPRVSPRSLDARLRDHTRISRVSHVRIDPFVLRLYYTTILSLLVCALGSVTWILGIIFIDSGILRQLRSSRHLPRAMPQSQAAF